jgi:hypothetical protein
MRDIPAAFRRVVFTSLEMTIHHSDCSHQQPLYGVELREDCNQNSGGLQKDFNFVITDLLSRLWSFAEVAFENITHAKARQEDVQVAKIRLGPDSTVLEKASAGDGRVKMAQRLSVLS